MEKTGGDKEPGIDGGLVKRSPQSTPHNVIGVPSVDDFENKIKKNGGTIIMSKMALPGMGWFALFSDPEGNEIGIMEPDESAK